MKFSNSPAMHEQVEKTFCCDVNILQTPYVPHCCLVHCDDDI